MTGTVLFTGGVQLLLLLLALSVHDAARAWMAGRCGDATARVAGRVSLSPLAHFDLLGTFLLPLLLLAFGIPIFGWGRPIPLVTRNLRRPMRDGLLVAAAGPLANALLALAATIALAVAAHQLGADGRQAAYLTILGQLPKDGSVLPGFPLMFTLVQLASINAFLVLFNLIPLAPLDGGLIALHLMPPDWAARYAGWRPYGHMVGIFLASVRVLTVLLLPFTLLLNLVINL